MKSTAPFWQQHALAAERSSDSTSAYAKRHGLALSTLYHWQSKLKPAAPTAGVGRAAAKLVTLRVIDTAHAATEPMHPRASRRHAPRNVGIARTRMAGGAWTCRTRNTLMHPGCPITQVYLCRAPIDFRKAINGLSVMVEQELGLDPFNGTLTVVIIQRRTKRGYGVKLKLVYAVNPRLSRYSSGLSGACQGSCRLSHAANA